jgi:hypothetical protein
VVLSLEGTAAFSLEAEDAAADLNGAKADVRAWQLVWRVFRTFAVVAQLVVSVTGTPITAPSPPPRHLLLMTHTTAHAHVPPHTENKVEEQTMHAAIKHLQALPAQFEGTHGLSHVCRHLNVMTWRLVVLTWHTTNVGVAQHVLAELEPAGTQAGGFNGAALREACFVVVQLSAWTAALFQAWSAAFPAKQRRKNHPANSVLLPLPRVCVCVSCACACACAVLTARTCARVRAVARVCDCRCRRRRRR